jgi:long-chain acyl-CoA synthetase
MNPPARTSPLAREQATATGMIVAWHAQEAPDRRAILSAEGDRSYGELNSETNRLARVLAAAGLVPGDAVALLCSNRPEFVEAYLACTRAGYRCTPINWHLTGEEVGYIVGNCEAKAFLADARIADAAIEAARLAPEARVRLAIGGAIEGFERYEDALAGASPADLDEPVLGVSMLYTSGTTGRPKGVYRKAVAAGSLAAPLAKTAAFRPEDDLAINTGPLYHAAPLAINLLFPLNLGVGVVLMDRWSPEETLRLVEQHGITHTHMVPTMFHRLLQLPEDKRARHDLSTLRWIIHGAAPCPPHVKQRMIDWLGPVVYEYYAASEGGGTFIEPEEWVRKPGSVGQAIEGRLVEIHDDEGASLPTGEVGTVYFKAPDTNRFEYYKAPEKTESAYRGDHFTMGDRGYFDDDGYLFLTGRSSETIISGGVNIYPAEIDAVLLQHPAVADVAVVGVPNEEWGEEVKAVVQLADPAAADDALAVELLEHCRQELAHYKCPRSVDFAADLPRLPTGKIVRRLVREPYWAERERSI